MNLTLLLILFFLELIPLYVFSRKISKSVYIFFYLLTRSREVSVGLLSFLLLPGTLIHELAHLLVAEILRVPTGRLSFAPIVGHNVIKAASVEIGTSDPIRRYIIGFAPVFIGIAILALITHLVYFYLPQLTDIRIKALLLTTCYLLLFTISNTMFSSKADLEGFLIFAPILILIAAAIYLSGIRISLTTGTLQFLSQTLTRLLIVLAIVLAINTLFFILTKGLLRVWEKLFKVKIN